MPDYVALLGRSFLLGLAIAAPIGPTSMTAIRRGLATGAWAAFWVGMGAALTDFLYIAATYVGFTPLLERIPGLKTILYSAGAIGLGAGMFEVIRNSMSPDLPLEDGDRVLTAEPEAVDHRAPDLRLARAYQVGMGRPGRWKVIGRHPSYHGMTLGTMAAASHSIRQAGYEPSTRMNEVCSDSSSRACFAFGSSAPASKSR